MRISTLQKIAGLSIIALVAIALVVPTPVQAASWSLSVGSGPVVVGYGHGLRRYYHAPVIVPPVTPYRSLVWHGDHYDVIHRAPVVYPYPVYSPLYW